MMEREGEDKRGNKHVPEKQEGHFSGLGCSTVDLGGVCMGW